MIKFEEHEGQLFRMLEKPVPLTPDSKLPCLTRLIQDDSPMGMFNKDASYSDVIGKLFVAQKIKENPFYSNTLHAYEKNSLNQDNCIASIHTLEIIGYPVEEGSAEWALYQMMQGKMVCHETSPRDWYRMYNDHAIQNRTVGYMDRVSAWLESTVQSGWQIYKEPEPEQQNLMPTTEFVDLSDAQAGWICKTRDGGNYPLKYIEVSPTRYAYEDKSGLTVYVMANGRYKKNGTDGRDIIACEPEPAKEPIANCDSCRHSCTNSNIDYCQMYEPKPTFKVGDWVTDGVVVGTVAVINDGKAWVKTKDAQYHLIVEHLRKLKPSEVVVPITISGTVRPAYNEDGTIDDEQFQLLPNGSWDGTEMFISFDALDSHTRKLVEGLLKAQEEEK